MKFYVECEECDGLVLIDKSNLNKLDNEILYGMEFLLDVFGKTQLIYDFPDEKWEVVRNRESEIIKNFCNSGEMAIWLLDSISKECEIQFTDKETKTKKWLNISSGNLLAVTASELIQCILYPELEMEKLFEIDIEKGWYAISKGTIDKIELSHKIPPTPPYDNIQEIE